MTQESNFVQAVPVLQFDPASLTGSFQAMSVSGFSEAVKVLHMYNGSTSAVDVSLNGTDLHAVWPAGGTLVIDLQANHQSVAPSSGGVLNARKGQNIWVRTSVNPTWLTVGGFR